VVTIHRAFLGAIARSVTVAGRSLSFMTRISSGFIYGSGVSAGVLPFL